MIRGLFVTFEGPEGSGKSTQVGLLASALDRRSIDNVTTREPGGTATADKLRDILLSRSGEDFCARTELLLLEAARADHVSRVIRPALEDGKVVICDRFTDSSLAYQGGGRGLDMDEIRRLNDFATGGIEPDLTFVFDIDVREGLKRAGRHGEVEPDRMEAAGLEFHGRVRDCFIELARTSPDRYHIVDATREIEQIAPEVASRVLELYERLGCGKRQ